MLHLLLQADQICYAVLCVFSYVAAGSAQKQAAANSGADAAMSLR
jgi:hypothetical protein